MCGSSTAVHRPTDTLYIQSSQKAGQVVWYSHFFKNFPQFVVIHTAKAFSIVKETEVDFFFNSIAVSIIRQMLVIWSLSICSSVFSKSSFYIWKFLVHLMLKPSLKDFEHYLASMWNKHNCMAVWQFFGIALPWTGMKTDHFQSCGYSWVFQISWHLKYSTLTASSFIILNSSAGIPSPPLALFVVIILKACLTSLARIIQLSSVQSLSRVLLLATPWTAARQASLHHQLPEFTQTHIHRVSDVIQPSHPLSSPSPP